MDNNENEHSQEEWLDALRDDDEAVRFNAAVELASQKDPAAIPVLIQALEHDIWAIRHYHARRALVHLGEPATESLIAALSATTVALPVAAWALFELDAFAHRERALAALERALGSENATVREDTIYAL